MVKKVTNNKKQKSFRNPLWDSENKLCGSIEPSEYKHVMPSLIFLKFASDKFEERVKKPIDEGQGDYVEMVEFYTMRNVFYLPEEKMLSFAKHKCPAIDRDEVYKDIFEQAENFKNCQEAK